MKKLYNKIRSILNNTKKKIIINNKNQSGLSYGSIDAPIRILNYTSFQCSDCVVIHEKLHNIIKKYINNGIVRFVEKPINISRFKYDDVIYKHMREEQSSNFDELIKIYSSQNKWRSFESKDKVIEFLNLSQTENINNVRALEIIMKEKAAVGLKEVPTMFMNGERVSLNITAEDLENKIQELIKAN